MANQKKVKKPSSKSTIKVSRNRDTGKKKVDLFARLRNEEHPLDIIQDSAIEVVNLDSQISEVGYPNNENLDINIAKEPNWIAKEEPVLDINIAKEKDLDIQTSKKTGKWTKYDKARSTASVFIRAASELVNEVKHFNVENKLDMKEFFELAARSFIDSFGYPNNKSLAINIALEDRRQKILYKTDISIINLFREYNKIFNPQTDWRPKDDAVGVKYNSVDLRLIEIGIIQTQSNILENESDTKVERFKYYTREIDKFIATGYSDQLLEAILTTNRRRWAEITGKEIDLSFLENQ